MTECISWDYCFHFGRKPACLLRAHIHGKGEPSWKGKSRRQNWANWNRPHQSVISLPPTSLSGHCDDGHTHLTGIWVLDLKQCNPKTLFFTFCTKCKQCHSPQMQFNPKPKLSRQGLKDPGNCKMFLLLPHGGATLADLQSPHFLALLLLTGSQMSMSEFWWLLSCYFNIQLL